MVMARRRRRGLTRRDMLIVAISACSGARLPIHAGYRERAIAQAMIDIKAMDVKLQNYRMDNSGYPGRSAG